MGNSLLISMESLLATEMVTQMTAVLLFAQTGFLSGLGEKFLVYGQVALGLGFVIFVHELGHFLAAKTFGVRCDKFYVGFDVPISIGPIKLPSSLGKFQWGETEYGIGIIPLGGYVKMLGQDDDPRKAEEEAAKLRLGEGEDAPLDPRSYPAKPVWQRMIIISAGVIMNLIFAVILAGAAFWYGVPFQPTIVGSPVGGGPAWEAGLMPGDRILQVGTIDEDDRKMWYEDFATEVVSHGFEFKSDPLNIVYERDGKRFETTASPSSKFYPGNFYRVGLTFATTPVLPKLSFTPESYIASQGADLQGGDAIVGVNGEALPVDPEVGKIVGSELTVRLQENWRNDVTVTVSRPGETPETEATEFDITLPPVPVKELGLGFQVGPVTAIQRGSAAEKAGVQKGDLILSYNGTEVSNALMLPSLAARSAGEQVVLLVERAGSEVEIEIPEAPKARFDAISRFAGELTLGNLGVAFRALPNITSVSGQAESKFQVGDVLKQVQWVASKERQKELDKEFKERAFEAFPIDDEFTVACLYDWLQTLPVDSEVECIVERDGKMSDPFRLTSAYAEDWYWHVRGIGMSELKDVRVAENVGDAAALGLWETQRRFKGVLNFLRLLVTGRIGSDGIGGPGRIAYVAAAEADQGPSRLLIFLTMLSANLAILNFLPIPALDGGHMVFLTAEAIMGKPVNEALQVRLTMVGVLGLLSLMAFVIVKDIMWFAG